MEKEADLGISSKSRKGEASLRRTMLCNAQGDKAVVRNM
jgi:hypothetical protein